MKSFLFILFFSLPVFSFALPAQIILMRHAEKPRDKNDDNLSPEGYARAKKLPSLFVAGSEYMKFGVPAGFVAAGVEAKEHGPRCIQTLEPVAASFNETVLSPYPADQYDAAADWIMNNPSFDGKTVVVAWTHTYIVPLAEALGSAPRQSWKGSVYDKVWFIQYDAQGNAASTEVSENF